ncbi:MAG: MATE family efflux transporter [Planctomycetota bacterium]
MHAPSPPLGNVDDRGFWPTLMAVLGGASLDYTRGSLSRSVWLLAVPMVLEMAMESTFAVVDLWFVGQLGKAAVATVGLTESMMAIVYAIGLGLAMSTTAMVARRVGEGDLGGAARAGAQAITLVALLGVCLGAPCVFFGGDLLGLMGASPAAVEQGSTYTSLVLGSHIVVLLLFVQNAIFRGAGDAMLAMKSLWFANLLNCLLDPLFIFGWGPVPAMGVTGAGVATLCGRGFGVLYQIMALRRGRGRLDLSRAVWKLDVGAMATLVRLSAFGIGQFLIATASWVVLNAFAARFGDASAAGYTVGVRILVFTYLPAWGLSNAVGTLVGQNLGAKDPARAERATWQVMRYNVAFMSAVGLLMLLIPEFLVAPFSDETEVRAIAAQCLRVFSIGYPMFALGMVLVQALNGAGDTVTPTWINLIAYWLVEIPVAWTLAVDLSWGASGVFWSVVIGESLMAVLALAIFLRGKWKTRAL